MSSFQKKLWMALVIAIASLNSFAVAGKNWDPGHDLLVTKGPSERSQGAERLDDPSTSGSAYWRRYM